MPSKLLTFLYFILLLIACQEQPKTNQPNKPKAKIITKKSAVTSLSSITEFQELLAADKGNVVLVNLWATWCKPCVYEMPTLEKLHKNYENKGLKIITLSIDEYTKADSLVTPYWEKMAFTMENYVINAEDPGALVNAIDPLWIGLIPTSFLFNQNGEKVESITGRMNYEAFEKKVLGVLDAVN